MVLLEVPLVGPYEYSDEEYTERRTLSVITPMEKSIEKDTARIQYLVESILEVCRDMKSAQFYAQVARVLPDDVIFRFLSEIKADQTIRNRGAVFTSKASRYVQAHGIDRLWTVNLAE